LIGNKRAHAEQEDQRQVLDNHRVHDDIEELRHHLMSW
jgi:hypothetical protein